MRSRERESVDAEGERGELAQTREIYKSTVTAEFRCKSIQAASCNYEERCTFFRATSLFLLKVLQKLMQFNSGYLKVLLRRLESKCNTCVHHIITCPLREVMENLITLSVFPQFERANQAVIIS